MRTVDGFYVYSYCCDDERQGWISIEEFKYPLVRYDSDNGETEEECNTPQFRQRLKQALVECGWEGDGRLEAMMFPPWLGTLTGWFPVFHIKQSNNGTSWIASERKLTLEELNEE